MRSALVLFPYQEGVPYQSCPQRKSKLPSGPRWGRWPAGLVGKAAGSWKRLHLRPRKRLLNCFEVHTVNIPSALGIRRAWSRDQIYVFGNARCHRYCAGRPCWTKTERRGLVDGALGPADDIRDVSTSQTSSAVAARDGGEQIAQATVRVHMQLAAGVIQDD